MSLTHSPTPVPVGQFRALHYRLLVFPAGAVAVWHGTGPSPRRKQVATHAPMKKPKLSP